MHRKHRYGQPLHDRRSVNAQLQRCAQGGDQGTPRLNTGVLLPHRTSSRYSTYRSTEKAHHCAISARSTPKSARPSLGTAVTDRQGRHISRYTSFKQCCRTLSRRWVTRGPGERSGRNVVDCRPHCFHHSDSAAAPRVAGRGEMSGRYVLARMTP